MDKVITPRFATTAIGAMAGGTLLEQDNDASGLVMGLGIGGLMGYNFNLILPDKKKMIYRPQEVVLPKLRAQLDEEKEKLKKIIDKFSDEQIANLPSAGDLSKEFNPEDIYGTLHINNINEAIDSAPDIETLRRIKIAAMNPERFTEVTSNSYTPGVSIRTNNKLIHRIDKSSEQSKKDSLDRAMNSLEKKFQSLGYSGEELEEKMAAFKLAASNADQVVTDELTDKVAIHEGKSVKEFKISSSHATNGISSYTDTNNFYTVRSINPFAKHLVRDPDMAVSKTVNPETGLYDDGISLLNKIGVDLSSLSADEQKALSRMVEKAKLGAFSPEDLQAILSNTEVYEKNEKLFDALIDSAYQHQQHESGFISSGVDRNIVEAKVASDLAKRQSGQQDYKRNFNFDTDDGNINIDDPLRDIGVKSPNGTALPEHRRFREILQENGFKGVIDGQKADHNTLATNGKLERDDPLNVLSPVERNPHTASREVTSRINPRYAKENSIALTMDRLKKMGRVPSEYGSAIASKRLSVSDKTFNKMSDMFNPDMAGLVISDGGDIAMSNVFKSLETFGNRVYTIDPNKDGILTYSDKVLDVLRNRERLDVRQGHTAIRRGAFDSFNNLLGRYDKAVTKLKEAEEMVVGENLAPDAKWDWGNEKQVTERFNRIKAISKIARRDNKVQPGLEHLFPVDDLDIINKMREDYAKGVPARYIGYPSARSQSEYQRDKKERAINTYTEKVRQLEEYVSGRFDQLYTSLNKKMAEQGYSHSLDTMSENVKAMGNAWAEGDREKFDELHSKLRSSIEDYNKWTGHRSKFRPGDVIGIQGNGEEVKLSSEFESYSLIDSTRTPLDGDFSGTTRRDRASLIFEGSNVLGDNGSVKFFSSDNKANMIMQRGLVANMASVQGAFNQRFIPAKLPEDYDFDAMRALIDKRKVSKGGEGITIHPETGYRSFAGGIRRDMIGKSEGTILESVPTGKVKAPKKTKKGGVHKQGKMERVREKVTAKVFWDTYNNEYVALSDRYIMNMLSGTFEDLTKGALVSKQQIGSITSIGGSGQKVADHVFKALTFNTSEEAMIKHLRSQEEVNGVLTNTDLSLPEQLAKEIVGLAKKDSATGRVSSANEAWAIGQFATSLTEGKASQVSLFGVELLGLNRLERDIAGSVYGAFHEAEDTFMIKALDKGGEDFARDFQKHAKAIDMLMSEEGYITRVAHEAYDRAWENTEDPEATGVWKQFKEEFKNIVETDFLEKTQDLRSNFSSGGALAKFVSTGGINQENANLYRYAYDTYGVTALVASPDSSQGYSTGSGKTQKAISHLAQGHLLSAGATLEMLDMFGQIDGRQLYDLGAVTSLDHDMTNVATLNDFLDTLVTNPDGSKNYLGQKKADAIIERLSKSPPETVNQILKDAGAPQELIDAPYLRFKLGDNAQGMTNLPIYKNETTRYGEYISSDEVVSKKPLMHQTRDLLVDAYNLQYKDTGSEELVAQGIRQYAQTWTKTVGNINNPMLKQVLSRVAPNSSYSKVIAIKGSAMGDVVEKYMAQGKSVAGISSQKAVDVLKSYLYSSDDEELTDIANRLTHLSREDLAKKHGHTGVAGMAVSLDQISIEEFLDEDRVLMAPLKGNEGRIPLYTLLNREPSHSAFSVSPYFMRVLTSKELNKSGNYLDSVHIHEKDTHYTALTFGDFDNDHVLLYHLHKAITYDQAQDMEAYVEKIAQVRNQMIPLMESLGVKGQDRSGLYSIYQAMKEVEQNMGDYSSLPEGATLEDFKGTQEYWDAVDEVVERHRTTAGAKGGIRKTLSAPTVQLASDLNTAINLDDVLQKSFLAISIAKGLTHAVVENVIKTQHINTDEMKPALEVESIFNSRKKLAKGDWSARKEYETSLKNFILDMVDVAKGREKSDEILELEEALQREVGLSLEDLANRIVDEDIKNIKNPRYSPTGPLHYSMIEAEARDNDYSVKVLSGGVRDAVTRQNGDGLSQIVTVDAKDLKSNKEWSLTYEELKKAAKRNLIENKLPLMVGAAALGLGAIITQKEPDFRASPSVRADTQAGTLAPAMASNMQAQSNDSAMLQAQGRQKTDYIRPGKGLDRVNQNYRVSASYEGQEGREAIGAKEAIYGKNITNVNINQNGSSY